MKEYLLGLYEKAMPHTLTIAEKLRCAKAHGYDFMELSIDETDEKLARLEMGGAERKAIVDAMWSEGLPIGSICLSGHRKYPLGSTDPAVRARSLEMMEKAVALAADLGIRTIQIAGYDVYYDPSTEETRAYFLEGLLQSTEMAARAGVVLAFETMETPFMDTVTKAMAYVEEVSSPYLQVYPDVGNCTNAAKSYGTDMLEDLRRGRGHLAAVHLKETVPGKYREIEYGTGHVDFSAVVAASLDMGVRRFVTEMWDVPEIPYEEHIRYSKAFIDGIFAAL